MKAALEQFHENLSRARALLGLGRSLLAITTSAIDLSDLYHASLVLGVSALDQFVHEFVRLGMIEVHRGARPATDANLSFKVPLAAVKVGMADPAQDIWLDATVRQAHSWQSFQQPDSIADAIRLVSGVKLWEEVAKEIGSDAKNVKVRLTAIVARRNQIAHEADMDPTNPGTRWPIDSVLVENALEYISRLVLAIFKTAG